MDLREQIARKLEFCYQRRFDPQTEITITCGGTEALYDAIQSVVGPGDEAIIFDPAYDSYEPAVRLAGARCVRIALETPGISLRLGRGSPRLERAHPAHHHQQSAKSELYGGHARRPRRPGCLHPRSAHHRIADEVYEHVLFDGRRHQSVLMHPELERAQLCGVLLRQDLACHRLADRLLRGAARVDARAAQSASVQHLQHRLAAAIRHCPLSVRLSRCVAGPGGIFSGQARSVGRSVARLGTGAVCRPPARIFNWWTTGRSARKMTCSSPTG